MCADDAATGPAVVLERARQQKSEAQRRFSELAATGSEFTVWPIDGRWQSISIDQATLVEYSSKIARLHNRHPELLHKPLMFGRRIAQSLAHRSLKRCYASCFLDLYYGCARLQVRKVIVVDGLLQFLAQDRQQMIEHATSVSR